jgi:hypothetical protein
MTNIADGFAVVKVGAQSYDLAPSFCNIANIGTPKEIVDSFRIIGMRYSLPVAAFAQACKILEECGLPNEATGGIVFNEWKGYSCVQPGILPVDDVYVLAMHCLKHGVSGSEQQIRNSRKLRKKNNNNVISEFNAYQYIISAVDFLNMSTDEAEKLTMTRYIKLVSAKSRAESIARGEPTEEESKQAYSRYEKAVKLLEQNRINKG